MPEVLQDLVNVLYYAFCDHVRLKYYFSKISN